MYLDNWYAFSANGLARSYAGYNVTLINLSGDTVLISDNTLSFTDESLILGSGSKPVSRHDYCLDSPISSTIAEIKQIIQWYYPTDEGYEDYFYYSAVVKNNSQEVINIREAGFKIKSCLFCRWVFENDIVIEPNDEIVLPILSGCQPMNKNLNRNFRNFLYTTSWVYNYRLLYPTNVLGIKLTSYDTNWSNSLCIKVGNSNIPFNENQYHLQGYLDCAYLEPRTVSVNFNALNYQQINPYWYKVSQLIQNNFTEPITIKEIGLYNNVDLSKNTTCMLAREVLDEPIILQPGQIISLSMTLAPWED